MVHSADVCKLLDAQCVADVLAAAALDHVRRVGVSQVHRIRARGTDGRVFYPVTDDDGFELPVGPAE